MNGLKFTEARDIVLFADENKNIVIFPQSISDGSGIDMIKDGSYAALYPIELKYPYTATELSEKIEEGFMEWNKHECYNNFSGKNTYEEKYFGIKGFKNAVKGKKYFAVDWGCKFFGNSIRFQMPLKRGYAYLVIKKVKLADDADYIDYANAIIDLLNLDLTTDKYYKLMKDKLNT